MLRPSRRPKTDPPALAHGRQDPVNQQIRPAEPRMLPRDVIGMHDSRPGTASQIRAASVVLPALLRPSTARMTGRPDTTRPGHAR